MNYIPKLPEFVYCVMRNVDVTEGRGPMVYVATFATFEAADSYVMCKGSPYGHPLKVSKNIDGTCWSYNGWYEVHKHEVLPDYDIEQVKMDLAELKALEERVAILRSKTNL